ncbi:putative tRNA-splicing endonuclease subunit tsp-4 [Madurella mycetomatis]|uniref:tRNA-splicing endonuclease subunit Sen34 n=1 Tax=Madurella mycetomatis TaxID=100816 RepID=A0A175W0G4_9PEZI|nr:putative tRNA-splicing endonuclease subunit tsp-4 [Madurella mycetomatis]
MAATVPERRVRISRIAGRYLLFDIEDVMHIRRHHGICAVLTGTMPQNPTQNLFLGLPVELHAEEARLLVDKKAGYIADELPEHLSQLAAMDEATRKAYLQSLKKQRKSAQLAFEEERAKAQAKHQSKRKAKAKPAAESASAIAAVAEGEGESLFDAPPPKPAAATPAAARETFLPAITPTTSCDLLASPSTGSAAIDAPSSYPLYGYLNSRGYYTTPGLRFGGDYSVYPGDPFRYHAHYLANSYGWDEEIPMLDLVTSGRLGTAVKKSFLFGAEKPVDPEGPDNAEGGGEVRVFCIEWAGM